MTNTANSNRMSPFERLLVGVDTPPWDAVYRVAVGYATLPAMSRLWGEDRSGWALVPFVLGVLAMLRVIPAMVRKLGPFSDTVRGIWQERRQTGKRYDSYQWRKLFWIGVGLAVYTVQSGRFLAPRIVVSAVCVVSGAVGLTIWRATASRIESAGHLRNERAI
jgi:hypothetical protein